MLRFVKLFWLLFLFVASAAQAQNNMPLSWAHVIGNPQKADYCDKGSIDKHGNLYITGRFYDTVDFDPGIKTNNLVAQSSLTDIVLAKYDSSGNYVWAFSIGSASSSPTIGSGNGRDIDIDINDNVLICGTFNGTNVDFDPGAGQALLQASPGQASFLAKYSSSGQHIWSFSIGGGNWSSYAYSVQSDASGNIFVAGIFQGINVDFDPGAGNAYLSSSNSNAYLAKYDANGNYLWAFQIGPNVHINNLETDLSGNPIIGGTFLGSLVDFNPGIAGAYLSSAGSGDIFLAKYSATNGAYNWAWSIGGTFDDWLKGIAVDSSNNIYITGRFAGNNIDFNPGLGTNTLSSAVVSIYDAFLATYNSSGQYRWAFSLAGTNTQGSTGLDVNVDPFGNVLVAGFASGSIDFDPGPGQYFVSSTIKSDIFLAQYSRLGQFNWAFMVNGDDFDTGISLEANEQGRAYLSGVTNSRNLDFDPGPANSAHTASGTSDMCIARYGIPPTCSALFSWTGLCQGDSIRFIDSSYSLSSFITSYYWDFGDGDSSTLKNPKHKYAQAGTYQVKLKIKNKRGYTDSLIQTIQIFPMPAAAFRSSGYCLGSPTQFTDSSGISQGFIQNYFWQFGDNYGTATVNPAHLYAQDSTYLARLITISNKGCRDTAQANIIIHPLPLAQFSRAASGCENDSTRFNNYSTLKSGLLQSFNWNFGDTYSDTAAAPLHLYNQAGTFNVQLKVSSAAGCSDSIEKTVYIHPRPKAAFLGANLCSNDSAFFINNSSISSGKMNFRWNFGDSSPWSFNTHPSHLFHDADTLTITLLAQGDSGCTDSASQQMVVYTKPKADFTAQDCPEDSIQLSDLSSNLQANTMYNWDFGNGQSQLKNPKHLYSAEGPKQVKLLVSGLFCKDSLSKSVLVRFKPKADFLVSGSFCEKDSLHFADLSQLFNGSLSNWTWNMGDGNTYLNTQASHLYPAGAYTVQLVVQSSSGCADTAEQTILVHANPKADFTVNDTCTRQSVQFNSTPTQQLHWNFGDNSTDSSPNPLHAYNAQGQYRVSLRISSAQGCQDSISRLIQVYEAPALTLQLRDACELDTVLFSYQADETLIKSRNWKIGPADSDSSRQPLRIFTQAGSYPVSLSIVSQSSCVYTDLASQLLMIHEKPRVNFYADPDSSSTLASEISFFNQSTQADTYQWSFGDSSFSSEQSPLHLYKQPGRFRVWLRAENSAGCRDSAWKQVLIYPLFHCHIPNAFSPNANGINESFAPVGEGWNYFRLQVYNRWGQLVFNGQPNQGWNGQFDNKEGQAVQEGIYTYTLSVNDWLGKKYYYRGIVQLLR